MIVRTLPDGTLMMIGQSDHARLSGTLAAHWGNATFARPRPYESTVRAAALHDCGWYRYETKPLYDPATKSTPTFMHVPLDREQLDAFQWGTDWLTEIDPYAGLLMNKHRTGLWRARYGAVEHPAGFNAKNASPLLEEFIARNEAKQKEQETSVDMEEFWTNYRLLQMWDFLSLYVCTGEPKEDYIALAPTRYGGGREDGVRITMSPAGGNRVKIDPYPFDINPLPVHYVYRRLPKATFDSEAEFRQAYYQAPLELKAYEYV